MLNNGDFCGEALACDAHAAYFSALLDGELHPAFQGLDPNRTTLVYFAVTGLDVLGALGRVRRRAVVEWLYAQQVLDNMGGFRGGPGSGAPFCPGGSPAAHPTDRPHLASTYTALATLLALGDDLRRVRRDAVLRGVRALQQEDGSFAAFAGGESDMRFIFCAAAIGAMLGDGGHGASMDRRRAVEYIVGSVSYEGGIGLGPGQEAHGGSTYCGLATLSLLGALGSLPRSASTVQWCVQRQVGGFHGRTNKDDDTCYSYWLGASLALLGRVDLIAVRLPALAPMPRGCLPSCRRFSALTATRTHSLRFTEHRRERAQGLLAAASPEGAACASTRRRRPTRCTRASRCAASASSDSAALSRWSPRWD